MGQPASRDETVLLDVDADPAGSFGSWDPSVPSDGRPGRTAPPGTRPGGPRGVLPAVGAIVLLTLAVAIGGFIDAPASTEDPTATAAETPVADCAPASLTEVPEFSLGISGGAGAGIGGSIGVTFLPSRVVPGADWPVPAPDPGRDVPVITSGTALEIRSGDAACIRRLVAEYADATLDHLPYPADRQPLRDAVVPPTPNPGLGTLPDGDWVVRVQAYLDTGIGGRDGRVIGERFFRVRVGTGPYPTRPPEPGPGVTPAAVCGPAPATPDEVELTLAAPGGEPVPGVADGTDAATIILPLGERATLAVVGDACARSWDVGVFAAETGRAFRSDVVDNPTDDPDQIAQNRWSIWATVGDFFVVARLHFGPGLDVMRIWRLSGPDFIVPETILTAADGRRIEVVPGCGFTYKLPNGYSVTDACDQSGFPEDAQQLRVPAWSRVVLEVPGWTITTWDGSCGRTEMGVFVEADYCPLGAYAVPDGDAPPAPVQFLARPGEWAIRLHVRAGREGTSYDGQMYARVTGE